MDQTIPDVLSTQREVDGMEKEISSEDGTSDRLRQLSEAKAKLATLLEKYSPTHPDVIRLQHEIDGLEKAVQTDAAAGTQQTARGHADNPVYIQVKGQLDALTVDRESEVKKRDELQAKFDDYEKRMAQSPDVERQYREMTRELEAAQLKYQEILSKQTEAQVAENLETERKGEKFTLIEPPQPPEKPVSPNRPLILIAGLVMAIGVGLRCGRGPGIARRYRAWAGRHLESVAGASTCFHSDHRHGFRPRAAQTLDALLPVAAVSPCWS
jgi:succinoglycan biosynthesis transport protein ExoP